LKYRFWTTPDGYKENPDRISQGYLIRWAKGNLDIVNSRKNDSFKSLFSKNLLETIFGNLKPWIPDENSRLLFEQKSLESQAHAIFLQRSALQMSISDHKFLMK
jgi:hypothetical protein